MKSILLTFMHKLDALCFQFVLEKEPFSLSHMIFVSQVLTNMFNFITNDTFSINNKQGR